MTFNTIPVETNDDSKLYDVLNLVINGWPSIHQDYVWVDSEENYYGFKPCYKWMTFNTI